MTNVYHIISGLHRKQIYKYGWNVIGVIDPLVRESKHFDSRAGALSALTLIQYHSHLALSTIISKLARAWPTKNTLVGHGA